jgi:hypothetical protein
LIGLLDQLLTTTVFTTISLKLLKTTTYISSLTFQLDLHDNILDLVFTNLPDKVINVQGFEDILNTDHKLISFELDLKINKRPKVKREVFNFKKANWTGLKDVLLNTPLIHAFFQRTLMLPFQNGVTRV